MDLIRKGGHILALCRNESDLIQQLSDQPHVTVVCPETFANDNHVTVESAKDEGTYDAVVVDAEPGTEYGDNVILKFLSLLKSGKLLIILRLSEDKVEKVKFILTTNGFINVNTRTREYNGTKYTETVCLKPSFKIGSSAKLIFQKPTAAPAVWKLDANDDIVNPDELLDDEDFKKPEEESLRVCGTTGKRKACKDCSCGLADELDAEAAARKPVNSAEAKSSCGSCYLGDAFRCAACPYLGMPAFKPGEKVQLSEGLLKADS